MLSYYNNEVDKILWDLVGDNPFSSNDIDIITDHISDTVYMYDKKLDISTLKILVKYILEIKHDKLYVYNNCLNNKKNGPELIESESESDSDSESESLMSIQLEDLNDDIEHSSSKDNCNNSDFISSKTDKVQLSSYKDLISHANDYSGTVYKEKLYNQRKNIVKMLNGIPQHEQGTKEWLDQRKGCITATAVAVILDQDPNNYPIETFMDKCGRGIPFIENKFVHHGKQYEQIGNMFYSFRNNVTVGEYGLIQHSEHKFIGASPDGICTKNRLDCQKLTNRVGRLLEIKFPYSRKIEFEGKLDGDICPHYYYVQVQTQLFVTGLTECDFLQCKAVEYDCFDDYVEDSVPNLPGLSKKTNLEKGVMIRLSPRNLVGNKNKDAIEACLFASKYVYPPKLHMTISEIEKWVANYTIQFHDDELSNSYVIAKVIFWKLERVACNLITYDKQWFESQIPVLKQFWNYVEFYRKHPKKLDELVNYVSTVGIDKSSDIFNKINKQFCKSNKINLKPLYQKDNAWRKEYNTNKKYTYKKKFKNLYPEFPA